jgi:hypothetical protein
MASSQLLDDLRVIEQNGDNVRRELTPCPLEFLEGNVVILRGALQHLIRSWLRAPLKAREVGRVNSKVASSPPQAPALLLT